MLQREARGNCPDLTNGVANGLLIAIPFWVLVGAVLVFGFQEGPMSESASLAFMIAAVVEAVLVRYAFRGLWPKFWQRGARKATFRPINRAATANEDSVAYLEKMAGRRIASIEDMLRFVAVPQVAGPVRAHAFQSSTLRHTTGFAALAIAFLNYYFWDVSLQIASLNSVTVFVAVTPLQKFAA